MPLLAGSLNFAWEINAFISSGAFWGHVLWLVLDVFIIILNIYNIRKNKNRLLYCLLIIAFTIVLRLIFVIPEVDGMLISVFAIDLIMAFDFVVNAKKISVHGKIPIAITKLLGDLFAWFAYSDSAYVNVIGIIVFLLNLYYLAKCFDLSARAYENKCKRRE